MVHHRRGEFLARPRHPADALFIVRSGRLRVSHPQDEELGPGGWVGAGAVLLGPPVGGLVVAVEDVELARLPRSCIDEVLRRSTSEAVGRCAPPSNDGPPTTDHPWSSVVRRPSSTAQGPTPNAQ